MINSITLTRHGRQRAAERAVPLSVIEMILDYGESRNARDGAQKYALSKASLREVRRDFGAEVSSSLNRFRRTYVVSSNNAVITVAFAQRPLFH
ncbi:MAG: hypothetical protein WA989_13475 [Henriciella sp.]|uniref:hypothetical protein n=1 Tax=Henriciella sp. TaxID=1968823 RepID=UPI003C7608A7